MNTKAVFALILGVLLMLSIVGCFAHDHDKPELNGWYPTLKNQRGGPCCDGSDFHGENPTATALDDVEWTNDSGHFKVLLEGKWLDVPPDAVVVQPNRDGRAIVWFGHANGEPFVRCFLPGTFS
jgi:hypothetical protein